MRHKRLQGKRKKLLKKPIHIILCVGIIFALSFCIKNLFFDNEKPVHASQENFELPGDSAGGTHSSSKDDFVAIKPDNTEKIIDKENVNNSDNMDNVDSSSIEDSKDSNIEDNKSSSDDINGKNNTDNNGDSKDTANEIENSVFLGDSITEALSYYKFVNRSHVIADKGYTAKKAISAIDKIADLNPDKIFIMFGLNDILTERNVDRFIKNYTDLIHGLKEKVPGADIYIQSILPVDPKVKSSKLALSNSQIEEFNVGLKNLAQQENIGYLDVASIVKQYDQSLHEPDGIHYKSKFCALWIEYIKKNI